MGTGELSGKPDEMLGDTCHGLASHPGGVDILLCSNEIRETSAGLGKLLKHTCGALLVYCPISIAQTLLKSSF